MKQLKRVVLIMLFFTLVGGVYGCGTKSPSNTVEDYLEEVKKGESGEFSDLLNQTLDKAENKEETQKQEISDETTKKLSNSIQDLTYTINSEKIDGDSATVNVKINGPDMAAVMTDYIQKAFTNAFAQAFSDKKATDEENNKLYDSMLLECLDNVKYTERTGDISLTKTEGDWKINKDDALTEVLINIDNSAFNSQTQSEENSIS
ncbi:DUF4878 domain-containing protein [Clostridium vincentii]|uniref:Lumazine-binding domain protein n=1 Tax=Clostridium vincentii TaxID=52704 RepID=A0A2T0BHY2_9CLOT|nr:DUF4878 domain-containing protein [Clostridium vincentii]PRR83453.1 Lumazine-binding domain protein [Clostridium vincentii]